MTRRRPVGATVLGLDGPSELVRERRRLVGQRAREQRMAAAYDEFYRGDPAPLPTGTPAAEHQPFRTK